VVKGTTPPPSDETTTPQSELNNNNKPPEDEDVQPNEKDHASSTTGGNNLPSVQTEALREKTDQWRKDRIDATAAIRKENKEKEVMEHRRNKAGGEAVVVGSDAATNGASSAATGSEPVPAILSVQSKFPEHKRKAAPDDHSGKKIRVSEESSDSSSAIVKTSGAGSSSWRKSIPGWVKISAAVLATGAIVAMRVFRRRK